MSGRGSSDRNVGESTMITSVDAPLGGELAAGADNLPLIENMKSGKAGEFSASAVTGVGRLESENERELAGKVGLGAEVVSGVGDMRLETG